MPLPSSGQISISDITFYSGTNNYNLGSLAVTYGITYFGGQIAMSQFYGKSVYTYINTYVASDPCTYSYYDIYQEQGTNLYYGTNNGGASYTLMYSLAQYWFEYLYYDPRFDANVYNQYRILDDNLALIYEGNTLSFC
jgi:hypothetical protein